jgi:hypothetical protein
MARQHARTRPVPPSGPLTHAAMPARGSAYGARPRRVRDVISFGSSSSSTLRIRSRLVDGGPRPWAGLWWATPRTSSRSGRLRIGCRACCSCRFRRRRQARTDSILTSVRSIKPQKSNVSFPSVLGGPMSGSVMRRGWYSQTLKAMNSASFVDGFGPIPRSGRHRTTLRSQTALAPCRPAVR